MKKLVAILVSAVMLFAVASIAIACGNPTSTDLPLLKNSFKATSCDLIAVSSAAASGSYVGGQVVFGKNREGGKSDKILNSLRGEKYFVGPLYGPEAFLTFEINSTEAVTGATLYLSLSTEFGTKTFDDSTYKITVNGTDLTGFSQKVLGSQTVQGGDSYAQPFKEYSFGKINLVAGKNTIVLTPFGNTWGPASASAAPSVDYLRIDCNPTLTLVKDWWPENKVLAGIQ